MIFQDDTAAIDFIKSNQNIPAWIIEARAYSKELSALVNGELFVDELISKIEHIESEQKIKARKKYSRSIIDFFERLFFPITNVFSSTGGIKKYDIKADAIHKRLLETISSIRDGKSIERYVESHWMPLYHTDPNGIIFLEYSTIENIQKIFPTYKSISNIRTYKAKGQLTDVVLFEPQQIKDRKLWRIVDDVMDRFIWQDNTGYRIDAEKSFIHPFGEVPAIIISDVIDVKNNIRLSPIHKIVPLAKEYARDQSIKTLYKFLHGFPTHWRYVSQCRTCTGIGKKGNELCTDCGGRGYYQKTDVTDMVTLPVPDKDGVKLAPDIAGFISPDLATWMQYSNELETLEKQAQQTHWGVVIERGKNETATGRFIDVQPVINKLNRYADVAEWIEWKITEWTANFIDTSKNKNQSIALIVYGRRYIIEGVDVIQKKYEEARAAGENNVVLDRLFAEFLTVKYKNDLEWLRVELLKSKIEPYLHLSISEINTIFGAREASKKVFFQKWWQKLTEQDLMKDDLFLNDLFLNDFELTQSKIEVQADAATVAAQASLRGSVGGVTGIVAMLTAVSQNQMTPEAVKAILIQLYGIPETEATEMIKKPTQIN